MPLKIDETEKKYGKIRVISEIQQRSRSGGIRWLCRCDCGKETIVDGQSLRTGHTKSCGCWQKEKIRLIFSMPDGMAARRAMLRSLKFHATDRNYEYDLSDEFALNLMVQDCFYCGAKPEAIFKKGMSTGEFIYNGIDRVDNSKGYFPENVVPCCKHCNKAKQTRSVDEFLEWVKKVYEHSVLKKESELCPQ